MDTPILFLVFNRPDSTRRVFEEIRVARPRRLYIAADGPRGGKPGEAERCAEVRRVASEIDWECEVRTLFRNENLGCRRAVSGAITWFFEHEEAGIILEDDCLPSQHFFEFCAFALERWKDDTNVMHIGGHVVINRPGTAAVGQSRLVPIWGWATWRRAWSLFDSEMERVDLLDKLPLQSWYRSQAKNVYRAIRSIHDNKTDAWGARWALSVVSREAFSILPSVNLISNIGFGDEATHTKSRSHLDNIPHSVLADDFAEHGVAPVDASYDEAYLKEMNRQSFLVHKTLSRIWRALRMEH